MAMNYTAAADSDRFHHKIHESTGDRVLTIFCYTITGAFALCCLVPFIYVIMGSFTDELTLAKYGFSLWPRKFSLEAYKNVFTGTQVFQSYAVSIFVTAVGTALSLLVTCMLAYPLSTGKLRQGRKINFFVYFTMLFNGGLVPTYMLISRYLNMRNSLWVMIIPVLVIPWNMFLMRNFFNSIPSSLAESARIDGANEATILFRIILPCATPALATIGLFYALGYWNQWFQAMLYIDTPSKFPLQYLIMRMMRDADFTVQMASMGVSTSAGALAPSLTIKLATAMVTIGPIVLIYPFVQKYFTSGIMVGSVKG